MCLRVWILGSGSHFWPPGGGAISTSASHCRSVTARQGMPGIEDGAEGAAVAALSRNMRST